MNAEQLNKLKELAQKAIDNGPGNWPFHSAAFKAHITPAAVLELIALAERTTSPVQVEEFSTHEVIGKIIDQMSQLQMLWGPNEPGALVRFREVSDVLFAASRVCRASMAAAAPHAQAVEPQPVAEQGELPPLPDAVDLNSTEYAGGYGYTADHMHAYARAAIAASRQSEVPHECRHSEGDSHVTTAWINGWNDCRSTMLGELTDDPTNHAAAAIQQPDVKAMVDRFLGWKLPENFYPDCHISFDRERAAQGPFSWPIGTNLLTADQAEAMFRYCLGEGAK